VRTKLRASTAAQRAASCPHVLNTLSRLCKSSVHGAVSRWYCGDWSGAVQVARSG